MLYLTDSDRYMHRQRSVILVIDPESSDVFVKKIGDDPSAEINRLIFLLALLKRSGYVPKNAESVMIANLASATSLLYYGTLLHMYLFKHIMMRGNENLSAEWTRSKSGHWTYVLI